jgi:hypothetical protein
VGRLLLLCQVEHTVPQLEPLFHALGADCGHLASVERSEPGVRVGRLLGKSKRLATRLYCSAAVFDAKHLHQRRGQLAQQLDPEVEVLGRSPQRGVTQFFDLLTEP